MKTPVPSPVNEQRLILRGRALDLLTDLIGGTSSKSKAAELRDVLQRLALPEAGVDDPGGAGALLERGTVPAYETSYEEARSAQGGMTFQMADIAGFYRAFGVEVTGERPDHIVPELQFVALLFVKEAHARISRDHDSGDVCAVAREKFVREHLGPFLRAMEERSEREESPDLAAVVRLVFLVLEASED